MRIRAFCGIRPPPELAERVAAVPYDVVDTAAARALAAGNPDSFLHVTRPEIDLPGGTPPHDEAVYRKARENLADLHRRGRLRRDPEPALFVYRLTLGKHRQSGLVAVCHVDDYRNGVIRRHERTLQAKEDDRTRHVAAVNANTGPVLLTYRDVPEIDGLIGRIQTGPAMYDFVAPDGVRHEAWRAVDPAPLVAAFAALPASYIADGHHRAASAERVGRDRRAANPAPTGEEAYNWFLGVLFPAAQLKVMAYNRLVRDLNGRPPAAFLAALRNRFAVTEDAPPAPEGPRRISMYLAGRWYGLGWEAGAAADPVSGLDVSVLQDAVLQPLLGIDDPRTNDRIDFLGGIHGTEELRRRVDAGAGAAAFSLWPTGVDQMMAVADAGRFMPPKSTWFEPKLRSGLFVHPLT